MLIVYPFLIEIHIKNQHIIYVFICVNEMNYFQNVHFVKYILILQCSYMYLYYILQYILSVLP